MPVKIYIQYLFILLSVWLLTNSGQGQQKGYEDIKNFYREFKKSEYTYVPPVKFISEDDLQLDEDQEIMQIMLIRHGVPMIKNDGWFSFYDARNFILAYDTVAVYPIQSSPVEIRQEDIQHVYSSPLNRAKTTAQQLFGDRFEIIYDPLFIEFKNEILPLPWIRLPLKTWRVTSRLIWMAGLHSSRVPSLPSEKNRSRVAASRIAKLAGQEKKVVIVAHGFLNRYLIRYLKKEGWHHSFDGGYGYLNVQVLTKIVQK